MKRKLLYTIGVFAALFTAGEAAGQTLIRQGNVAVEVNGLSQAGDSLYVDMHLTVLGKNVASDESADYIPVLVAGRDTLALPAVSLRGKNNYKAYQRKLALMSPREREAARYDAPFRVLQDDKRGMRSLDYRVAVAYQPWMDVARIDLKVVGCNCGKSRETNVSMAPSETGGGRKVVIVHGGNLITPHFAYLRPGEEAVKQRTVSRVAYLDFPVGSARLDPAYGNNRDELFRVSSIFSALSGDSYVHPDRITITGYASPEGSRAINRSLSERRAGALADYLTGRYAFPAAIYDVRFGGEDWAELLSLVENSRMKGKESVEAIIRYVPDSIDEVRNISRKKVLMDLDGGDPWRYMLRKFFPALRRTVVKVDYTVASFDLPQARQQALERPQNLSLAEFFAVAQSYPAGSDEYNETFETAVRMFPDDRIANINAAVAALSRRDYVSAARYLDRVDVVPGESVYDNAMGLLLVLRDRDAAKARPYFEKAVRAGLEAARQNLAALDAVTGNKPASPATENTAKGRRKR